MAMRGVSRVARGLSSLRTAENSALMRLTATRFAGSGAGSASSSVQLAIAAAAAALVAGAAVASTGNSPAGKSALPAQPLKASPVIKDAAYYQRVYDAIADILDADEYDDGSYGPVLVRLAWHAAGSYDKATNSGGSNGATMRYALEAAHGANAGLQVARDVMEKVKAKFPEISYSDLWSLAGVAAIQQMGGPTISWRPGRVDATSDSFCTPDGRLPDATKKADHLRSIFYRMGFNDQEIVALSGAHALGRCHTDRSGFVGPWTRAPTTFSTEYFRLLLEEKWVEKKWNGPRQFVDAATGELMMLPSDLALIEDPAFRKHVEAYAKNSEKFFADFAAAFRKLEELGVPFPADSPTLTLKKKD